MEYIEELYNGNLYPAEIIPRSEEYTTLVKEYGHVYDIFVKERGSEILDDDEAIKDRVHPIEEELNLRSFREGFQKGVQNAVAGKKIGSVRDNMSIDFNARYLSLWNVIRTEMDYKPCLEAIEEWKRMGLPDEIFQIKKRLVKLECENKYLQGLELGYGLVKEGLA